MNGNDRQHPPGEHPPHEEQRPFGAPVTSRQVARRVGDGGLELVEVPTPTCTSGTVLVRLEASVLSPAPSGPPSRAAIGLWSAGQWPILTASA